MNPGYGMAIEKYDDASQFIGHSGRSNAYNTQMYYVPEEKAFLITLVNTDTALGGGPLFFATIAKIIFPGSFPQVSAGTQ
jgi:hypothetical protein